MFHFFIILFTRKTQRVSTKEMIGNKYGTVHVCMKDLKDHSDKLDNVLHEQAVSIGICVIDEKTDICRR